MEINYQNKTNLKSPDFCQATGTGTGTWDLGLGTWDLGLGTWDLGPGTWDLGPWTLDLGIEWRIENRNYPQSQC